MKILIGKLNTLDPFRGLFYPHGATGLTVNILGYHFAQCKRGYWYILQRAIESQDVIRNGEAICTASPPFYNTYWRVKTLKEARWVRIYLMTGKSHYKQLFEIIRLGV